MIITSQTPYTPAPNVPLGFPPQQAGLTLVTVDAQSRPGYLTEVESLTWPGRKVRRISEVDERTPDYPRHQCWNLDGTRIFLQALGVGGFRFLDGNTYADLGNHANGSDYPVWSNTDADKMYGANGTDPPVFRVFSVASDTWTTIRTFTGYNQLLAGAYEGNISLDDRRVAIQAFHVASSVWHVMVYDPIADSVITTIVLGATMPQNESVSLNGEFLILAHGANGSGADQGTKIYDAQTGSLIRHLVNTRPHMDPARDAGGNDILVHEEGAGGLTSHRFDSGQNIDLFPSNPGVSDIAHVSGVAYQRPGWVYISCNTWNPTLVGNDQLYAVKTDGSETVEVYGFAHAAQVSNGDYTSSPHMSPSRDGKRVIFRSAWDGSITTEVFAFVAGMAT